jgi:soluble lytic murein transglycosylase
MRSPDGNARRPRAWTWALAGVLLAVLAGLLATSVFWDAVRPILHKDLINKYAAVYKFDPLLVMALVKVESNFQKTATSRRGAIGLMQLMPDTARDMASRIAGGRVLTLDDLRDPDLNLRLGMHYLSLLRDEFGDDLVSILAADNAGPANARAWRAGAPLSAEAIPFGETRRFVERVTSTHRWLKRFQKVKNVFS